MLSYNEDENICYIYKNKMGIPKMPDRSKPNVDYLSFMDYIQNQCEADVREIFMPALREILKQEVYDIDIADVKIGQGDAGYFNNRNYLVQVKFQSIKVADSPLTNQYITILEVPMVDESGLIYHENKRYALIKMLEQDETISYDTNKHELKMKLPRRNVVISAEKTGFILNISSLHAPKTGGILNFNALYAMFAMAKAEGYEPDKVFTEFKAYSIRNLFKTPEDLMKAIYFYGSNRGSINAEDYDNLVVPTLMGKSTRMNEDGTRDEVPAYAISSIRDELNDMLSLDRAVGRIVAKDVYSNLNPDELILRAGSVVTETAIQRCKAACVYNIFVDNIPNMQGYYLAQFVFLDIIPKGTKMIDVLKQILPNEKGMYVSKDYTKADFPEGHVPFFGTDTCLTADLIKLFKKCGYSELRVSLKPGVNPASGKGFTVLHVMEEILSNRCFRRSDVPSSYVVESEGVESTWVYLNAENKLVPCPNYYTTYDLAALISLSAKLSIGKCYDIVANIDTGFRKKLVMLGEQYHRAFNHAVKNGLQQISRKLKETYANNNFFLADEMYNQYYPVRKEFFSYLMHTAKCLQPLIADALTNPVAFASACSKVNVYTSNRHSVADSQRGVAIGQYGRVDVFETPQSAKLGVVLNLAQGCEIDRDGTMKVKYYVVRHAPDGRSLVTKKIVALTVTEEEDAKIADMSSLVLDDNGYILNNKDLVLARVPSTNAIEKQTFSYIPVNEINYVNVEPSQWLSYASSTIPFLGSNNAVRAVFGVAQIKQMKGEDNPEVPIVMTYANKIIPRLNDEYCIFAEDDGEVIDVRRETKLGENYIVLAVKYAYHTDITEGKLYEYPEFTETGYSVTIRKIIVQPGQRFKKDDILMTSNFVKDGILTLGVNALVAYVPTGYNYEDGVHASQSLCNRLTSYRYNTEVIANPHPRSKMIIKDTTSSLYIEPHKNVVLTTANEYKRGGGQREVKQYTNKAAGFYDGAAVLTEKKEKITTYEGVKINLVSINPFSNGDKGSNRHGNKGVMPKVEDNSMMLRLTNGIPMDMCYNPHGVTSRMNVGQIKEANLGLTGYVLGIKYCFDSFNSVSNDEIRMLLSYTVDLMNSTGDPEAICKKYPDIPEGIHRHCCKRISSIRFWANTFDKNGEAYLINPKKGNRLTETKCLVGINYIGKLIQESDKKVHARGGMMSCEPYTTVGNAPTKGTARQGGQRFGYMEVYALCAYGASNLLKEYFNLHGDNAIARSNFNVKTFLPKSRVNQYLIDSPGQRRSVTRFLYTLLALGLYCECDDEEFFDLDGDTEKFGYYDQRTLSRVLPPKREQSVWDNKNNKGGESGKTALDELAEQADDQSQPTGDYVSDFLRSIL